MLSFFGIYYEYSSQVVYMLYYTAAITCIHHMYTVCVYVYVCICIIFLVSRECVFVTADDDVLEDDYILALGATF